MGLMTNLIQRSKGGNFYVLVNVPPRARHLFGGKKQIWKSTGTRDKTEALRIGAPIVLSLKDQIAGASAECDRDLGQSGGRPEPEGTSVRLYSPDEIGAAIHQWCLSELERCRTAVFNGVVLEGFVGSKSKPNRRAHMLMNRAWSKIPDFEAHLKGALQSQGIALPDGHHVLKSKSVRDTFGEQWGEVHRRYLMFRRGDFKDRPFPSPRGALSAIAPSKTAVIAESLCDPLAAETTTDECAVPLLSLFDRFVVSKGVADVARKRGYVKRLDEYLGGLEIHQITTLALDQFQVLLRRFPNTKRAIDHLSFREVISQFEAQEDKAPPSLHPTFKRLAPKTIWNWFSTYNQLFRYAVDLEIIHRNPVKPIMADLDKRAQVEREVYDDGDIAAIFSRPMFIGHRDAGDAKLRGYREHPGSVVRRDAAYWLPIFCLWHGCRLEEVGAARVRDIKQEDGISYLDLRDRLLKNPQSRRQLPLHSRLRQLGFLDYVAALEPDGYLFPELPHDPKDDLASTRLFSKWWGRWCRANAPDKGSGFDHPVKVFHSFRHSFKRACREAGISEEFSDLLTGHKGSNNVGREYGRGVRLAVLSDQMEKVRFATFPALVEPYGP